MKKSFFLFLIIALALFHSHMEASKAKSIRACDIGKKGYVIKKPGHYYLAEDVVFNPPTPAAGKVIAAITIKSSNVNLDLKNHRLALKGVSEDGSVSPKQSPFIVGILVPDVLSKSTDVNAVGLESIYITGDRAIIDGFSMYGIRVFGHTADIRISHITVKNCGQLASLASRNANPALSNYVVNSTGNGFPLAFGVGGIAIGESNYLGMGTKFFKQSDGAQNQVSQVVIENVDCLNNFLNGLNMANSSDVSISRCHFDETYSDDPNGYVAGAEFGGADLSTEFPSLLNLSIKNSTVNNTVLKGDSTTFQGISPIFGVILSPVGCDINQSQNIHCENCHFDNSSSTFLHTSEVGTIGFYSDGTINTSLLNCTFDSTTDIIAPSAVYFGLIYPCRDISLIGCTANNTQQLGLNQLPAPLLQDRAGSTAFNFSETTNLTMENCQALGTICNGPVDDASFIQGFDIFAGFGEVSSNIVLKGCITSGTVAVNGGQVQGFNVYVLEAGSPTTLQTIVMEDCISEGNLALVPTFTVNPLTLAPYGNVQSSAFGFFFQDLSPVGPSTSFPTSYINCKALNNIGITFDPPNNFYSAGFYTNTATNQYFYNCEADNNIYGFLLQNVTNSSVRNCRADNNSDGALTGGGFVDIGTGTPGTPTNSTSTFENNHAFNNGILTVHNGVNGNYNIKYNGSYANFPVVGGRIGTGFPSPANAFVTWPAVNISVTQ